VTTMTNPTVCTAWPSSPVLETAVRLAVIGFVPVLRSRQAHDIVTTYVEEFRCH